MFYEGFKEGIKVASYLRADTWWMVSCRSAASGPLQHLQGRCKDNRQQERRRHTFKTSCSNNQTEKCGLWWILLESGMLSTQLFICTLHYRTHTLHTCCISSLCVKFHEAVINLEVTGGHFIQGWRVILPTTPSLTRWHLYICTACRNLPGFCFKLNVNIIKWVCM